MTAADTRAPRGGPLRLGTRRSRLALTQSGWVADQLRVRGHTVELVDIVTHGDVDRAPLTQIGGTGVFVSALRTALRSRQIDLAVHSLKDLPVAAEPDLVVAAIPAREDPRDVLVARQVQELSELPAGARVGTGSPRRMAQLLLARPDLIVLPIRGNVDTRLAMIEAGRCDAVVLAAAGLNRLGVLGSGLGGTGKGTGKDTGNGTGIGALSMTPLPPQVLLPAPGQGALAVECRAEQAGLRAVLNVLEDEDTRACTTAERAMLAALEAGCTAPVGALAVRGPGEQLTLDGFVGTPDGYSFVRRTLADGITDPGLLGRRLAERMLQSGACRFGPPK